MAAVRASAPSASRATVRAAKVRPTARDRAPATPAASAVPSANADLESQSRRKKKNGPQGPFFIASPDSSGHALRKVIDKGTHLGRQMLAARIQGMNANLGSRIIWQQFDQ